MTDQQKGHGVTIAAYILHLLGAITGILSVVALIINYVKRGDDGAVMDSHHTWMIHTFWWAILWCIIGAITWFLFVGWIVLLVTWVWYIYRHIRGLICLADDKPMPACVQQNQDTKS